MKNLKVFICLLLGAFVVLGLGSLARGNLVAPKNFSSLKIISQKSDSVGKVLVVFDQDTNKEYFIVDKSNLKAMTQRLDSSSTVKMYSSGTTNSTGNTVSLEPVSDHEIGNKIHEYIVRDSETGVIYRIISGDNRLSIEPSSTVDTDIEVSKQLS